MEQNSKNAIVIGAGTSGLLASIAILKHFDKVTIIEENSEKNFCISNNKEFAHVILSKGFNELIKLLGKDNCIFDNRNDIGKAYLWHTPFGMLKNDFCKLNTIFPTKQELDSFLIQYLKNTGRATFIYDAVVPLEQFNSLSGFDTKEVSYIQENSRSSRKAEIIVVATGPSTAFGNKLTFKRQIIKSNTAFVSYWYQNGSIDLNESKKIIMFDNIDKENKIFGYIANYKSAVVLTLASKNCSYHQPALSMLEFARESKIELLSKLVQKNVPLKISKICYANQNSRLKGTTDYWPKNVILFGDSLIKTNPFWGMGLSQATIQANILSNQLMNWRNTKKNFACLYYQKVNKQLNRSWNRIIQLEGYWNPQTPKRNELFFTIIYKLGVRSKLIANLILKSYHESTIINHYFLFIQFKEHTIQFFNKFLPRTWSTNWNIFIKE